jgi:hypothetical protein
MTGSPVLMSAWPGKKALRHASKRVDKYATTAVILSVCTLCALCLKSGFVYSTG